MKELLFPSAMIIFVGFVLTPLLSIFTKSRIEYIRMHTPNLHGIHQNHLLFWLLLPTIVPVSWMFLNSIHLIYSDILHTSHHSVCSLTHNEFWTDEAILIWITGVIGLVTMLKVHLETKHSSNWPTVDCQEQQERIRRLFPSQSIPKISIIQNCPVAAQSIGHFPPRILLSLDWIQQIDDDMLRATILHEIAHIQTGDLWTSTILRIGMLLNPTAWLLKPAIHLWTQNKELNADQVAIKNGADPLALAQSIVNALRWQRMQSAQLNTMNCYLGSDASNALLKLRLMTLTEEHQPLETSKPWISIWFLGVFVILCTPHLLSIEPFDTLHYSIERLAIHLGVFQ